MDRWTIFGRNKTFEDVIFQYCVHFVHQTILNKTNNMSTHYVDNENKCFVATLMWNTIKCCPTKPDMEQIHRLAVKIHLPCFKLLKSDNKVNPTMCFHKTRLSLQKQVD